MTRERLLPGGRLLGLAALLAALLAVLLPARKEFEQPAWADDLTAAYLAGLTLLYPRDQALRLRLARQLLHLGRHAEAGRVLGARSDLSARLLGLDIDRAAGAPPAAIADQLAALAREALPEDEVARLAALALAIERPGLASDLYAALGLRTGSARALERAAGLSLQAGRPAEAGHRYAAAAAVAEAGAVPALAQRAVTALTAGGQAEDALAAARRFLARFPADIMLRRQARDIALSLSHLDEALVHGRALLRLRPDEWEARVWLARTAEWARRPVLALRQWRVLAERAPPAQFALLHERAVRLARGLGDLETLVALHEEEARRGSLSREAVEALVWAHDRLGSPDRAEAVLVDHLGRFPWNAEAWRALARLRERRGEREAARRAWAALRRLSDDEEALLRQTVLLIEEGARTQARALLREAPHRAALLALRGELAWDEGDDAEALMAYQLLWQTGEATEAQAERLLRLLARAHRGAELMHIARAELRAGRHRALLGALGEAAAAPPHPTGAATFDGLLRLARPALDGTPELWVMLGQWHHRQGQRAEALVAYHRALAISPHLGEAQEGELWLLIEGRDLFRLRARLSAWQSDALDDRRLWRPFAIGHLTLGAATEAAAWFAREWPERASDPLWLRAFGEALEGAGRLDEAERVRRLAERAGGKPAPLPSSHTLTPVRAAMLPPAADLARVGADSLHIGPLHIVQGVVGARRALGPLGAELRITPAYLSAAHVMLGELDVDLRGRLGWRWGALDASIGASLRTDASLARLQVAQQVNLRAVLLRAELALGEIAADTAPLRLGGARHRLSMLMRAEATRRIFAILYGDLRAHIDRTGMRLAEGYALSMELGYRLLLSRPALHLRLTGAWAHNRLAASLPATLLSLMHADAMPADVLPERFGLIGAGLTVGGAAVPGRRLRYLAELWLGWLWPQRSLGYTARLAVGLPLSGAGELSLGAHLANNQLGGLAAATFGFGIRYQQTIGRPRMPLAAEVPIL